MQEKPTTILRTSVGFAPSQTDLQREMFRDIVTTNKDATRELALVAGALAIDGAVEKLRGTNLLPASSLSSYIKELFDKVEV